MTEKVPFFSIIIPLFNKENFIEKTLHAVNSQTFQDFEIIVVNDGSTDMSRSLVEKHLSNQIKIIDQENQGVSAARNTGIKQACGEYLAFLDADDYWYPNFLETFYNVIQKYPDYSVFSAAIEIETPYKIIKVEYSIANTASENIYVGDYFKLSQKFSIICSSCIVFSNAVFENIEGFDTRLQTHEDTDLWIRIGLQYPIVFNNTILARIGFDPKGLSRNKKKLSTSLKYEKFKQEEITNSNLKLFLDLNRYSDSISNKIQGKQQLFLQLKKEINTANLSLKKRILLRTPKSILIFLLRVQPILIKLKLRNTIYK